VLACLQRACQLPLLYDATGSALRFLSESGAVVLSGSNVKAAFRQELVQAVVRDVPLCVTSGSASVLSEIVAASNKVSAMLLDLIKSGKISCDPQLASQLIPAAFDAKKSPQPTKWETALRHIIDGADGDCRTGHQPVLLGRCFRSCVSFTMAIIVTSAPVANTFEPKNAAVALECIG
jgi:hypothetical protein